MRSWLVLVALIGAAGAAGATPPLCSARVSLQPQTAYVGQQVIYEVRILRREDVRRAHFDALRFPGLRVEWLPSSSETEPVVSEGARYSAVRERRALHASRPGEVTLPGAALHCEGSGGEPAAGAQVIPSATLRVRPLPAAGRPSDFTGLVGPLELRVLLAPEAIELGQSSRLSVSVSGPGNLWAFDSPIAQLGDDPSLEVLARAPELSTRTGATLGLRRVWSFDLVPRRAGPRPLPALELVYFDPEREGYQRATAAPPTLRVAPRAAAPGAATGADTRDGGRNGPPAPRLAWLVAGITVLLGGGAALVIARRRRRDGAAALDAALADAEAALARGEHATGLARLSRALRLGLEPHLPGARTRPAEELLARGDLASAVQGAVALLAEIERQRFAGVAAPQPDIDAVRSILTALERTPA